MTTTEHVERELANLAITSDQRFESITHELQALRKSLPKGDAYTSFRDTPTHQDIAAINRRIDTLARQLEAFVEETRQAIGTLEQAVIDGN